MGNRPVFAKLVLLGWLGYLVIREKAKPPWWLKKPAIVNLMGLGIVFPCSPQLILNGVGIYLESSGKDKYIAGYFLLAMGSQWVSSLLHPWLFIRFGPKSLMVGSLAFSCLSSVCLAGGMKTGSILFFYAGAVISAGCGQQVMACNSYLLRFQLSKDHIAGDALQGMVRTVAFSVVVFMAFRISFGTAVGFSAITFAVSLIMAICVQVPADSSDRPSKLPRLFVDSTKKSIESWNWLPQWIRDPATIVVLGSLPFLIGSYCFPKILPLSSVFENKEQVGTILALINLGEGVIQYLLSKKVHHNRPLNSALFTGCFSCAIAGLVFIGFQLGWLIGAACFAIGSSVTSLLRHTAYEVSQDKVLGNNLPVMAVNTAGILGGFYIGVVGSSMGYDTALKGLILLVAVSWISSILLRRYHQLPSNR